MSDESKKEDGKKNIRDLIIAHAQILFSERGYDATTFKDLADIVQINPSLISYHFTSKENLYRAVLEQPVLHRADAISRVIQIASTAEEFKFRLKLWIEEMVIVHTEEPEICKMLHRDIDLENPIALEVFHQRFKPMVDAMNHFIADAQKKKFITSDVKNVLITSFIFGSFLHIFKNDLCMELSGLKNESLDQRKKKITNAFEKIFLNGLLEGE